MAVSEPGLELDLRDLRERDGANELDVLLARVLARLRLRHPDEGVPDAVLVDGELIERRR